MNTNDFSCQSRDTARIQLLSQYLPSPLSHQSPVCYEYRITHDIPLYRPIQMMEIRIVRMVKRRVVSVTIKPAGDIPWLFNCDDTDSVYGTGYDTDSVYTLQIQLGH